MIRPATMADCDAWLQIRNEQEALFWSGQREPISPEQHQAWFAHTLAAQGEGLYVLEESNNLYGVKAQPGTVVGYGRVQQVGLVSLAMAPRARGQGYGGDMLTYLENEARLHQVPKLLAVIHPSNVASMRAFMRAGYSSHPVAEAVVQRTVF